MTREDIIRMAREAGWDMEWGGTTIEQVMAFAEVVAAAEREACAEICACEAQRWGESPKLTLSVAEHWMKGYEEGANSSAEKIRARGDA